MRTSGNNRVPVDNLVGGIVCFVLGILSLLFLWYTYAYGFETQGAWFLPILPLLMLFGGSIWGFVLYYQEKREQRELEIDEDKEERERQRQQIAAEQK